MRKILISFLMVMVGINGSIAQVSLRFANFSPDSAFVEVDVWIDGQKRIDNLAYNGVSGSIEVDTGAQLLLTITDASSVDTSNSIAQLTIQTNAFEQRLFFYNGIASAGYSASVAPQLFEWNGYLDTTKIIGYTNISALNATGDVALLNLRENEILNGSLANDIAINEIETYQQVESLNYTLDVINSEDQTKHREIKLNLDQRDLGANVAHVVCSGFIDQQANNNGPLLELFLIPDTAGKLLALDNEVGMIQFVNNSYDPMLESVDVYIGTSKRLENVSFREASIFIESIAGINTSLGIAQGGSTSVSDTLVSMPIQLTKTDQKQVVLNGTESNAAPVMPLELLQVDVRLEANIGHNADVLLINGCPDISSANVVEFDLLNAPIFSQIGYGTASAYNSIAPTSYQINLTDGTDTIRTYKPNLSAIAGTAETWIVSGIANTNLATEENTVGIWVANLSGGKLTELGETNGINSITGKSPCKIYPNPTSDVATATCLHDLEKLVIYSTSGNRIKEIVGSQSQIDLSEIPLGQYIIAIHSKSGITHEKLSVVR